MASYMEKTHCNDDRGMVTQDDDKKIKSHIIMLGELIFCMTMLLLKSKF